MLSGRTSSALNDDSGEKARERLVAMEIAAFEEKRDDNHAMRPPLKVARMLISRTCFRFFLRRDPKLFDRPFSPTIFACPFWEGDVIMFW